MSKKFFDIDKVQKKIGYTFSNSALLKIAFSHASYTNERRGEKNNERLEYLGDSVLGFIVADFLFKNTIEDEGDMTSIKQSIVSCKPLVEACNNLKLYEHLLVGDKVEITDKLKENLMESTIGAIYLDGGLDQAKKFILKNLIEPNVNKGENLVDHKSKLNELSSKQRFCVEYQLLEKKGADNDPIHTVAVLINGKQFAVATERGKRQKAEQAVAKMAFEILNRKN